MKKCFLGGLILFLTLFFPYIVNAELMKIVIPYSNGEIVEVTEENREKIFGSDLFLQKDTYIYHGITFNIQYQDINTGFNDPVLGPQRKQVLINALDYVADVLNTPGGRLDLNVSSVVLAGQYLANAGPIVVWTLPLTPGVNNGCAYQHLLDGSVDPNGPSYPDMQLIVNWNYNYYLGTGTPSSNQFDLLSVLIHEITHGIGFLSAIAYNDSQCGGNRPDGTGWSGSQPDIYTSMDTFLVTGNNNYFISSSFYFIGQDYYFTGGDNGVYLNAPNAVLVYGSKPRLYSPSSYQCGSSISHWNNLGGVMDPSIAPGVVKRSYMPFEVAFLRDIGYVNASLPTQEGTPEGVVEGAPEGAEDGELICNEILEEGGFEEGGFNWRGQVGDVVVRNSTLARSGSWLAIFGGAENREDVIWQEIDIPRGMVSVRLSLWYKVPTYETTTIEARDVFEVGVADANWQNFVVFASLSNLNSVGGIYDGIYPWRNVYIEEELDNVTGIYNRFYMTSKNDTARPTTFMIDDVSLEVCISEPQEGVVEGTTEGGVEGELVCYEILRGGGFEEGRNNWQENPVGEVIVNNSSLALSGSWLAMFGGKEYREDMIWQTVGIPQDRILIRLKFWYRILTYETVGSGANDKLWFGIANSDLTDGLILTSISNLNATETKRVDLTETDWTLGEVETVIDNRTGIYRVFFIKSQNDFWLTTTFLIDDISLEICGYEIIFPDGEEGMIDEGEGLIEGGGTEGSEEGEGLPDGEVEGASTEGTEEGEGVTEGEGGDEVTKNCGCLGSGCIGKSSEHFNPIRRFLDIIFSGIILIWLTGIHVRNRK